MATKLFQKLTAAQVREKIAALEANLTAKQAERENLQGELTQALADGVDVAKLQERASQLDAVLASGPAARKLLEESLQHALEADCRPVIAATLKKIASLDAALKSAADAVGSCWRELGEAFTDLRGMELPQAWGSRLKIELQKSFGADPARGVPMPASVELRVPNQEAEKAIGSVQAAVSGYAEGWRTFLSGIVARIDAGAKA